MKKGILAGILLAFILFLAACTKVVPVFEQYASGNELLTAIDEKQLTAPVKKLEQAALEWARTNVKFKYLLTPSGSRAGIKPHLARVKGVSAEDTAFPDYSDAFTLHATLCTVDFVPLQSRTENLQELGNDCYPDDTYRYYRSKVLVLSVEEDGVVTCIGIRSPGEFDSAELGREVYARAAEMQELCRSMKPFPEDILPEGFTVVPLDAECSFAFANEKYIKDVSYELTYQDKANARIYYSISFDREGNIVSKGKGFLNPKPGYMNRVPEQAASGMVQYLSSPDGAAYAYSDKYSLYFKDSKGSRLLLEGNYTEEFVGCLYDPYRWIDNRLLIYREGVYEGGEGCGVVDTKTGTIIARVGGSPMGIEENKLYCLGSDEGSYYQVSVLDLKKPEQSLTELFSGSTSGKLLHGFVSYSLLNKRLAYFEKGQKLNQPNRLIVLSLEDGKVIKDYSFYQRGLSRQVTVLDETMVALYRGKDMLLVDLSKLK